MSTLALLILFVSCSDNSSRNAEPGQPDSSAESTSNEVQLTPTSLPAATPTPTATPIPPTPTATPTPTPTATPTPTPTPQFPPEFKADLEVKYWIDDYVNTALGGDEESEPASLALTDLAVDPDGELVSLEIIDGPDELSTVAIDGVDQTLIYKSDTPQTQIAKISVTDDQGLSAVGVVTFKARYKGHPNALIALGDSVASGHGLELADYLGGDPCFRSATSYPRRTFNALIAAGLLDPAKAEFALLACSGHDTKDLYERQVTGGFSNITPPSGMRTQLDWAIRSNPQMVTITIGANDTGFIRPRRLFKAGTGELDTENLRIRMETIETDLDKTLAALTSKTDATIFVTNYYNPTSPTPHGVANCRGQCFVQAAQTVVNELNSTIERAVSKYDSDRVKYVDISTAFEGKGASNGLGSDELREEGFGSIGGLVIARDIQGVHPYCQKGHDTRESWINIIDCVHPDEIGTSEIARIVAAEIAQHLIQSQGE